MVECVLCTTVKEIKLLDITYAAGVEKLDKEEKEVGNSVIIICPCLI